MNGIMPKLPYRAGGQGCRWHGFTVLLVEDSRHAAESVRLLCLRSGARIRRADSLRAARRHLACYRPTVAIVDVGLPDGSGLKLIRDLAAARPKVPALLAISGDDTCAGAALAAGADRFLDKPVRSLAAFQHAILSCLPDDLRPIGPPRAVADGLVDPDPLAYAEDLAHAARLLDSDAAMSGPYALQLIASAAASAGMRALPVPRRAWGPAARGPGWRRWPGCGRNSTGDWPTCPAVANANGHGA
jgi:CheY-like chemotaxis protein